MVFIERGWGFFFWGFSFLLIVEKVVDREIKEPPRNLDLEKFTKKNKKVPLDHKKEPPYLKKFTSRSRKKPHQSKNKVVIGKVLKSTLKNHHRIQKSS